MCCVDLQCLLDCMPDCSYINFNVIVDIWWPWSHFPICVVHTWWSPLWPKGCLNKYLMLCLRLWFIIVAVERLVLRVTVSIEDNLGHWNLMPMSAFWLLMCCSRMSILFVYRNTSPIYNIREWLQYTLNINVPSNNVVFSHDMQRINPFT